MNLVEQKFSHGDVISLTGLDSRTLTKWQQRGVIGKVGEMQRTGRRLYTFADLIKLSVIREVVSAIGVQPAIAAGISDLLLDEIVGSRSLIQNGKRSIDRRIALFVQTDGVWGYDVLSVQEFITELTSGDALRAQSLIPIDDIIISVLTKVNALFEEN